MFIDPDGAHVQPSPSEDTSAQDNITPMAQGNETLSALMQLIRDDMISILTTSRENLMSQVNVFAEEVRSLHRRMTVLAAQQVLTNEQVERLAASIGPPAYRSVSERLTRGFEDE